MGDLAAVILRSRCITPGSPGISIKGVQRAGKIFAEDADNKPVAVRPPMLPPARKLTNRDHASNERILLLIENGMGTFECGLPQEDGMGTHQQITYWVTTHKMTAAAQPILGSLADATFPCKEKCAAETYGRSITLATKAHHQANGACKRSKHKYMHSSSWSTPRARHVRSFRLDDF